MQILMVQLKKGAIIGFMMGIYFFSGHEVMARHRYREAPPIPKKENNNLRPQQSPEDVSKWSAPTIPQNNSNPSQHSGKVLSDNGQNIPPPLVPRYRHQSKTVNGTQGWINSTHHSGKHDLGINSPIAITVDPKQSGRRHVFRRSAPIIEPDY